jgi:hypothetical protein
MHSITPHAERWRVDKLFMPPTTPAISGMIFLHPPWRPIKEIVSAIWRIFLLDALNFEILKLSI